MTAWPKDNQTARNAFYGDPGKGQIAAQMVPVVPPFAMYYESKRVKAIQFHRKAAPALLAALNEIWDYCQHDQAKVDAAGVSKYAGAYNHRLVRGSKTKWSNHAYAAAIDLNAGENALGVAKGTMPQFVVDAFCRQGAMWGGWYSSRPDWMHFEFVDNGGRQPKSPRPVFGKVARLFDEPAAAPQDELEDRPEPVPVLDAAPVAGDVDGDPELFSVKKRLRAMNYNPGVQSGVWGGMTAGAIAGFINDRSGLNMLAPTSLETFNDIRDELKAELSKAEGETPPFVRPVTPARANAEPGTVAAVAPEVVPAKRGFVAAAWGSVLAFLSAVWSTVSGYVGQAWDWFTGNKDSLPTDPSYVSTAWGYVQQVPGPVWGFVAAAGLGFIAWNAFNSVRISTESVKTGARQ
ncbi:hypothetical protein FNL56_13485 [Tardiphaga sp. vice304]|uniref:M15 family metallopeptidase n=1 Tax=Tardiphaga sp. vice304 TaxID=2592817 RepID=UPI001161EB3A|nr:M15 family metallopeptidase [Tardiphaga sp. vice304]QDM27013.1 hypothetical protein FNL56_13485 [Tardiphaga sp. vice304]